MFEGKKLLRKIAPPTVINYILLYFAFTNSGKQQLPTIKHPELVDNFVANNNR